MQTSTNVQCQQIISKCVYLNVNGDVHKKVKIEIAFSDNLKLYSNLSKYFVSFHIRMIFQFSDKSTYKHYQFDKYDNVCELFRHQVNQFMQSP